MPTNQAVLMEMVYAEMTFHARALEVMTKAHSQIAELPLEDDLVVSASDLRAHYSKEVRTKLQSAFAAAKPETTAKPS